MKRLLCALLAAVMLLSLCGCTPRSEESDKLQVVCTLFPYYDFARVIGGDDVDVTLLVAAGKETHSFEPTPLGVIRVSEADVFLYNGGESELWVEDILSSAGKNISYVARMMDYADTLAEEIAEGMQVSHSHEEADGHEEEIEYDEHIWTSPIVVMGLCQVICDTLCEADPTHAENYQQRLAGYLRELETLDDAFRQVAENAQQHLMVFGDRFPLLYFCKTYGLDYRAAFHGCAGDTEPSLSTLKYLIDKVNEEHIPVVYTIELSSQKIASAIAESTRAQVRTFYSCQSISRADFNAGETYLTLMWRNVAALKEGLDG